MTKISALTEYEVALMLKAEEVIKEKGMLLYDSFKNKSHDLEIFADVVSRTPSLIKKEHYVDQKKNIISMVEKLSTVGVTNQLTLPTRAILGRSFIITKINFYYFISKVISNDDTDKDLEKEISKYCEKLVFLLMLEETYELIIENNLLDDKDIVKTAAEELSYLWEHRMDKNLDSFSSPLIALWKERCTIIPVLGSLKGVMEILMLSSKLSDDWADFLSQKTDENNIQALEEFVFGLNHEEITSLRKFMTASNMSSINRDDAIEILKKEYIYKEKECIFLSGDAKAIYSFFHKRLHNVRVRKFRHDAAGPTQTIEELFLIHLLEAKNSSI